MNHEEILLWDCIKQILQNQTILLSTVLHKEARDTMQKDSNELIERIEAKALDSIFYRMHRESRK
jgi:hypothetical protein